MTSLSPARAPDLDQAWSSLDACSSIVTALRRAEALGQAAALDDDPATAARLLDEVIRYADPLGAIAALHAIGRVASDRADAVLVRTLHEGDPACVGHAAWVLGGRIPQIDSIPALIDLVVAGGFDAMLAQRTLVQWSAWAGEPLSERILARLVNLDPGLDIDAGTRLVDVLRAADAARLPVTVAPPVAAGSGLTVVQPFLHARLDAAGSHLGTGDAGGIASLLRSLGTELARQPGIAEVVTVTRANPVARTNDREAGHDALAPGHRVARIPYGPSAEVPLAEAWIHRIPIERELARVARSLQGPVVWHVRMADVGTLAATAVARTMGHPVVFTVAPDPHAVIAARQSDGRLDRSGFGAADAAEHLWFRARMVERLAVFADQLVALPRRNLAHDLADVLGLDPGLGGDLEVDDPRVTDRVRVIAEGVDTAVLRRAEGRADHPTRIGPRPGPVAQVLADLPAARRGLPWLLTVGRLHLLKGPHRLAEAWAGSADLADRFNLVIVGGDLERPSPDEAMALASVRTAAAPTGAPIEGLVLAGHRPPEDVAALLVHAARHDGVYVAASDKEEFGLAVVEALGAGLVVVGPERGGVGSYIDNGVNGVLVDTTSVSALVRGIRLAAARAGDLGRRAAARTQVERDLSVATMAERLAGVYGELAGVGTRDLVRSGS